MIDDKERLETEIYNISVTIDDLQRQIQELEEAKRHFVYALFLEKRKGTEGKLKGKVGMK